MIKEYLQKTNMSIKQLSEKTGIAYSSLYNLVHEKSKIQDCKADSLYKLANVMSVSMDELYKNEVSKAQILVSSKKEFELFKSEICHQVKKLGNIQFLISTIKSDDIEKLWNDEKYAESLYLLSMVDYLSRLEDIPLCNKYRMYRVKRIDPPIYPASEELYCSIMDLPLNANSEKYIPEFASHGIMEGDVFDVC